MIANHFKVSLESKPTIENLVYTVSLRFGCYAPDLIEPITATLYPLESRDRHGGPNPGNCSLLLSSNMAILSS